MVNKAVCFCVCVKGGGGMKWAVLVQQYISLSQTAV
jgi:hypothetical protein